ncbi:MAG: M6 family metalloprotease domain-containing protein [Prevotella sp.]|uniref:M6 family metalloprotease domain-containing protein n=1 Tax=Prevotella sp. TaxID=59823 RepID=UPI002A265231|nr:M6 family metalloprotease domain-containing protein [Prevotella sp.]MDD7318509.1 M6 family metalloprotease domain-containing protein [Prevotellaceae bacterium]MDY4020314.1 M6 family metalloprotease domain-containing protein [Prevotella sp.]
MNRIAFILASLLFSLSLWAAKVHPEPAVITQSDGTKITIYAYGNEHYGWYTTADGVLLYREGFNYYVAHTDAEGNLLPTNQLAHEISLRSEAEKELARKQNRTLFYATMEKEMARHAQHKEPIEYNSTLFPHNGSPRAIVILAEFTDSVFKDDNPKRVFEEYLNAEVIDNTVGNKTVGKNYGSVRRYFEDMSFGKFLPQFDIYGPVKLSKELKYYGEGRRDHMDRLFPEVCQLADEEIDFSQYDANGDGYIDLVYIICAGYSESWGQNSSDCIWPKSGGFNFGTYDGKKGFRYGVHTELNAFPGAFKNQGLDYAINGIGLFCHEFSHCMGLPDFYPVSAAAQTVANPGMEYWDIMDGGEYLKNGYSPTEYTAWEREAMGWFAIDELTAADMGSVALGNINGGGKAYRIKNDADQTDNEYLVLQYIEKAGWNKPLYGHGMLVTHVDYDAAAFSLTSNSVNNTVGHPRYTIIPADGEYISSYDKSRTRDEYIASMRTDLFPSTGFNELYSIPWYTGNDTKKPLLNIKENMEAAADKLTFDYILPYDTITPRETGVVENIFVNGMPEDNVTLMKALLKSYSNGDKVIEATEFLDAEIAFANNFHVNAGDSLHIDVFSYEDMQLGIGFMEKDVANGTMPRGMRKEPGSMLFDLKGKVWTKIEFAADDISNGEIAFENIGGIRISNGNGNTIYINNIYLFRQEVNSITDIEGDDTAIDMIYTPEGIRINADRGSLKKRLYIINGKKYMVK